MKQEDHKDAAAMLDILLADYQDDKDLRAEAMYWLGDCHFKLKDYRRAYQTFKRLTWDYPEGKWAKIARGRLTEEEMIQASEGDMQ
jgi:TolA-binding protein